MIRRAEEYAAHAALGNHGESSLRSFRGDGGFLVKLPKMLGEQVSNGFLAGLPERSVGLYPEEFWRLLVLGLQADGVAVGELDNQAGEFEEWVGFGS